MLGTGYFVKIAKINSQQKKQSVIIVKINSRKTQNITYIQKKKILQTFCATRHALQWDYYS